MATFSTLPQDVRFLIYDLIFPCPQHRVYCRNLASPYADTNRTAFHPAPRYNLLADEYSTLHTLACKGLNPKQKASFVKGMSLLGMGIKGDFDLSLMYVNRAISKEVGSHFFGRNIFYAGNAWDTSRFLMMIEDMIAPHAMPRFEKLEIDVRLFGFGKSDEMHIPYMIETLCELAKWANFRELILVDSIFLNVSLSESVNGSICKSSSWLTAIRQLNARSYFKIKVVLNKASARENPLEVRQNSFEKYVENYFEDPMIECPAINGLFEDINLVTGGELWMEDKLMWDNSKQIRELEFHGQDKHGTKVDNNDENVMKVVPAWTVKAA